MATRAFRFLCVAWFVLSCLTVILLVLSLAMNPWDHRISLSDDFHVGLWAGRAVFFNDAEYGPYRGSIIGLTDSDGNADPPLEREIKWGDSLGVYFRYFRWPDSTLWTLMVSLLWPLAIFGLPTAICVCVWWRRRVVSLPTKHARRVRHPCRNAFVGSAAGGGVGTMNGSSTLVASVGGGVGRATRCANYHVLLFSRDWHSLLRRNRTQM